MKDTQIIEKTIKELLTRTFAVTQQYLEIHKVLFEGDSPKVARVDRDNPDGIAIVYFPIKGEKFYLAIGVTTSSELSVKYIDMEPYVSVCFRAFSTDLSLLQLSTMSVLKYTSGRSKGDKRGSTTWKRSTIIYEPHPGPDSFEDKFKYLLDFLEQDRDGLSRLVNEYDGYIQVAMDFHNANGMLGGPHIDKETIKRMAALDLEINFDLYVSGVSLR